MHEAKFSIGCELNRPFSAKFRSSLHTSASPVVALLSLILTACMTPPVSTSVPSASTSAPMNAPTGAPTMTVTTIGLTPTKVVSTPTPPASIPASPTPTLGSTQPGPTTPFETSIAHLNPAEPVTISEIHMVDRSNGWAVGGRESQQDHILRTSDGGLSWQDVTPPEPAEVNFTASARGFFLNANQAWTIYGLGYNAGRSPVVWRTADGGESWSASPSLPQSGQEDFMSPSALQFIDELHGWLLVDIGNAAGSAYVDLFRTVDGGATWDRIVDPSTQASGDLHVNSMARSMVFADPQTGVISIGVSAYSFPFLNWTNDGGVTWSAIPIDPPADRPDLFEGTFCGVYWPRLFTRLEAAIVVECSDGGVAYLYTTSDGGQTWEPSAYPGGSLLMLDPLVGFALSRDLYTTNDGGQTWTKVKTVTWDGQFSFVSPQLGWAVARSEDDIALVKTEDGGHSWQELKPVISS